MAKRKTKRQSRIKYALKDYPWGRKEHLRDKEAEDKRLGLLAQEFGLAIVMVLRDRLNMTPERADMVLGFIIEQLKANRGTVYSMAALENIKKLDEALEEPMTRLR